MSYIMENHNTLNLSNALEFDNWIIVGAALFKMANFFWPVIVVATIFFYLEAKKEAKNESRK